MKIFALPPGESWIVDRFVEEWYQYNGAISTKNPYDADIVWVISDWCFDKLPYELLRQKKVVTTLHHIVPDKFYPKQNELIKFKRLCQVTDAWHVPCKNSFKQLNLALDTVDCRTGEPILVQPFWVNQNLWYPIKDKNSLRKKLNLPEHKYLIGSFQRDTEGFDLKSPKLEKGPDILCDYIIEAHKDNNDVEVVLGGWRRQYVMKRLNDAGIRYHYFEQAPFETLNELYNAIDLYVVGARYEGGPQSIVECAATQCNIVSTDVGLAPEILSEKSVMEWGKCVSHYLGQEMRRGLVADAEIAYENVKKLFVPNGFDKFKKFFETL
jgi:glycosyltransferase involved in cell wall biosynthesis